MIVAFYVRQQAGYFLLSTAFLVVYVFTLIGWVMQRRNVVRVFENGLKYRKFHAAWNEIESVAANSAGLQLVKNKREAAKIPPSVSNYGDILTAVKKGLADNSNS